MSLKNAAVEPRLDDARRETAVAGLPPSSPPPSPRPLAPTPLTPPTQKNREGYTLEGTKKQGISPKRRAKLLAKARESATAAAAKS